MYACTDSQGSTWEIYKDYRSEWRWRCKASNGRIIGASSEGYQKRSDCIKNAERFSMNCTPEES